MNELTNPPQYFYSGIDINKFKFFAVPQLMFDSDISKKLSMDARMLYCIMLDKVSLSQNNPNRFADEDGRIYIIYKRTDIEEDLQKGHSTVSKLLKELETFGLIERKKTNSTDRTNRIYVKNIADFSKTDKYLYTDIDFERFLFYMMPKELIVNPVYKALSLTSKMLYMLLLDRVKLSKENKEKYSDEDGRVFVLFSIESMMDKLSCSKGTIVKSIKELEKNQLLEKEKVGGFSNASKYYVLDFAADRKVEIFSKPAENVEKSQRPEFELSSVQNLNFPASEICTLERPEFELFNGQILNPNNTYNNNTYKSDSHQSDRDLDEIDDFKEQFNSAIELDTITTVDESLIADIVSDEIKSGLPADKYDMRFKQIKKKDTDAANTLKILSERVVCYVGSLPDTVRLSGREFTKAELIDKLLQVNNVIFSMAKDKICESKTPIRNYGAYMVSVLLDLLESGDLQVQNKVNALL